MRKIILSFVFILSAFYSYCQTYSYSNVIWMDDMKNEQMRSGRGNTTSYVGGKIKIDIDKNRLVISNVNQTQVYRIIKSKEIDNDVISFELEYKLSTTGEKVLYTATLDKFYLKFKLYSDLMGTQIYGLIEND